MKKIWSKNVLYVLAIILICSFSSVGFKSSVQDKVPPSNVTISYQSNVNEVDLSWTASADFSGIKGYQILRDGEDLGFTKSTNYMDTGLQEFTSYVYTIVSMDNPGNTITDSVTAKTMDANPPTAPADLTYAATASSINLSWTASTDTGGMSGYDLYNNDTYIGFTKSTTYTFDGLQEYNEYILKVTAKDESGKTTTSKISANTRDVTPPPAPSDITFTVNASSVALSWTSNDTGVGTGVYKIYRDKTYIGSTDTPNYTDKNLDSNTEYVYTIEAYDKNNNGPSSANITVKTYDDTIKVLSFNILNYSGLRDPNSREKVRAPKVKEYLNQYKPDIMGLQEINKFWLGELTSSITDYAVIGGYNENTGYDSPIFYLKSKYDLNDSGTQWLGDGRSCTWAVLRDKTTGKESAFVSTHLDYRYTALRKKEAMALMSKINEIKSSFNVPILCMGDFNEDKSVPDGVYTIMTSGILKDSCDLTSNVTDNGITFHDCITVDSGQKLDGLPIDYCFVNDFKVLSYKVTRDSYTLDNNSKIYPSDHFGVFVQVKPQ